MKQWNINEVREMILDNEYQTNDTKWLVEMVYQTLDKIETTNIKYNLKNKRIQKYLDKLESRKQILKVKMINLWKEMNVNGIIRKENIWIKKGKKST